MLEKFNGVLGNQALAYHTLLMQEKELNKELLNRLLNTEIINTEVNKAIENYEPLGGFESESSKRQRMTRESYKKVETLNANV